VSYLKSNSKEDTLKKDIDHKGSVNWRRRRLQFIIVRILTWMGEKMP